MAINQSDKVFEGVEEHLIHLAWEGIGANLDEREGKLRHSFTFHTRRVTGPTGRRRTQLWAGHQHNVWDGAKHIELVEHFDVHKLVADVVMKRGSEHAREGDFGCHGARDGPPDHSWTL